MIAVALLAIAVGAGLFVARRGARGRPNDGERVARVPRAATPVVIDGETNDPAWLAAPGPLRTGVFEFAGGAPGRPFSEARLLWRDDVLYVALYAADEDIRTRVEKPDGPLWLDDSFRMTFRNAGVEYAIEVSPKCVVSDGKRTKPTGHFDYSWSSGVRVGCDTDGTINDSRDMDEEWVVEAAIPLAAIGAKPAAGESFGMTIQRCDTPKGAPRVCTSWGETRPVRLVLE